MSSNPTKEAAQGQEVSIASVAAQLRRPARALIGWMSAEEARLSLAGRRRDRQHLPEYAEQVARARAAVADRPSSLDQSDIIYAAPPELSAHIELLQQNQVGAAFLNEGWQVSIADLSRVCAIQPHIFTDHAIQRVAGVASDEITSLASISLPLPTPSILSAQFDNAKQAWVFSSPNPNLRIVGNFGGELQPGVNGFGFVVGVSTSFIQVAQYQDRYLLRDGYHRAYGFLKRGIRKVPVFLRSFTRFSDLALPIGLLDQDAFLGDRPPLLTDYFDETVSVEVQLPAFQKTVIVQALELSTMG